MQSRTIYRLARCVVIIGLSCWVLAPAGCNTGAGKPNDPSSNSNEGEPTDPLPGDDADGDGVADELDNCPDTPDGAVVDAEGCSPDSPDADEDADGDGIVDADDLCADTPDGVQVGNDGCPVDPPDADPDEDADGVVDADDLCPNTPADAVVNDEGCVDVSPPPAARDSDSDGVADADDQCRDTRPGLAVDEDGCAGSQLDDDNDTVMNDVDQCPGSPAGMVVGEDGCAIPDRDSDGDGISDDFDDCKDTPAGEAVGEDGCPVPLPPDVDEDGVADADDLCPNTPLNADDVDVDGCAASQRDSDNDGVFDDLDECPNTPAGEAVDEIGCAEAEPPGGNGGGGGDPVCGDGDVEGGEECDDAGESATCNANCTLAICGDGIVNGSAGEECDPDPPDEMTCTDACLGTGSCCAANGTPGCEDALCVEAVCAADAYCCGAEGGNWDEECVEATIGLCGFVVDNDDCGNPITVTDGSTSFDNLCAMTDGPEETGTCELLDSDVWYCYTATCTGFVTISLCGSSYDTMMAVYEGCGCPADYSALDCSDDDCGLGLESRLVLEVEEGQSFTIRIGGYPSPPEDKRGEGTMSITCGLEDPCGSGAGDCFADNGTPGCDDLDCCHEICDLDPYCCDFEWDELCGGTAWGLCGEGFEACETSDESCNEPHDTPGCSDGECCQSVCETDLFCCMVEWDQYCADTAAACP